MHGGRVVVESRLGQRFDVRGHAAAGPAQPGFARRRLACPARRVTGSEPGYHRGTKCGRNEFFIGSPAAAESGSPTLRVGRRRHARAMRARQATRIPTQEHDHRNGPDRPPAGRRPAVRAPASRNARAAGTCRSGRPRRSAGRCRSACLLGAAGPGRSLGRTRLRGPDELLARHPRRRPSGSARPGALHRRAHPRPGSNRRPAPVAAPPAARRRPSLGMVFLTAILAAVLASTGTYAAIRASGGLDRPAAAVVTSPAGHERDPAGDRRRAVGHDQRRGQGRSGRRPDRDRWDRPERRDCHFGDRLRGDLRLARLDPDQPPRRGRHEQPDRPAQGRPRSSPARSTGSTP